MALFENLFGKGKGEKKGPILSMPYGPVRKFLSERKTVVERPKLFANPIMGQYITDTITKEMAIKATSESRWAQEWSEGMLRLAGVSPGEPDYEKRKKELARKVAERMWA